MLLTGLISFIGVVVLSLLGASDYFTDKALPSGIAWFLLGLAMLSTGIGVIALAVSCLKAFRRRSGSVH
jgi:hypothetical protein